MCLWHENLWALGRAIKVRNVTGLCSHGRFTFSPRSVKHPGNQSWSTPPFVLREGTKNRQCSRPNVFTATWNSALIGWRARPVFLDFSSGKNCANPTAKRSNSLVFGLSSSWAFFELARGVLSDLWVPKTGDYTPMTACYWERGIPGQPQNNFQLKASKIATFYIEEN